MEVFASETVRWRLIAAGRFILFVEHRVELFSAVTALVTFTSLFFIRGDSASVMIFRANAHDSIAQTDASSSTQIILRRLAFFKSTSRALFSGCRKSSEFALHCARQTFISRRCSPHKSFNNASQRRASPHKSFRILRESGERLSGTLFNSIDFTF